MTGLKERLEKIWDCINTLVVDITKALNHGNNLAGTSTTIHKTFSTHLRIVGYIEETMQISDSFLKLALAIEDFHNFLEHAFAFPTLDSWRVHCNVSNY